ncbi:uncharacterized protein LOC135701173 [Ochlerotatus camptorhynchus]|uniref:uncharacterized protein LOC135701173 n=1 Tax=Ochlerotatus camptorhynchus TaxID=644619 RepID=UPI0031E14BFF
MGKSKKRNKKVSKFLNDMRIAEQQRHVEQVIASYSGSAGTSSSGIQPDGSTTAPPTILTTEDGFPVNTLYANFVRNPQLCQQEDVVRKMFEKYGPVKDVRIIANINSNPFGFVSYDRCEDALRCLLHKKRFPHVYLSVADSWQQDAYKKQAATKFVESDSSKTTGSCSDEGQSSSGESSILQLNDDCLTLIFRQLGLMDLIALKNTNQRLASVVHNVLKRYRSFDFAEPHDKPILTVMDTKNILENVGKFIQCLSLSGNRFAHSKTTAAPRILGLIPRNCFHLRELEIHCFNINPSVLNTLEGIVSSLEALTLNDCAVDDNVERCLNLCLSLQRLQLRANDTITGACLKTIKGLKSLNVENCSQLEGSRLFVFLQNNPQLEYLNITGCLELHTNAISAISHLTELTHLACNDSYSKVAPVSMMLITRVLKIQYLELTISSTPSTDRMLQKFSKRNCLEYLELKGSLVDRISYKSILKMTELKELKIIGRACFGTFQDEHLEEFCNKTNIERLHIVRCPGVSEDKLIEFVDRNPQLTLLEIPSVFLTEEFVFSVLDALHRNGSFLVVIVDSEAWQRLQEKVDELPTLLKDNCRLLKIKVETDGDR